MEVRIIKTCAGLKEVRFLDGALVPTHVDLREVEHVELVELLTVQEWMRRFVPIAPLPYDGLLRSAHTE